MHFSFYGLVLEILENSKNVGIFCRDESFFCYSLFLCSLFIILEIPIPHYSSATIVARKKFRKVVLTTLKLGCYLPKKRALFASIKTF